MGLVAFGVLVLVAIFFAVRQGKAQQAQIAELASQQGWRFKPGPLGTFELRGREAGVEWVLTAKNDARSGHKSDLSLTFPNVQRWSKATVVDRRLHRLVTTGIAGKFAQLAGVADTPVGGEVVEPIWLQTRRERRYVVIGEASQLRRWFTNEVAEQLDRFTGDECPTVVVSDREVWISCHYRSATEAQLLTPMLVELARTIIPRV